MNLYKRKGIIRSRNNSNSKPCLSQRKNLSIINVDTFQYSKKEIYPNNNLLTVENVNPKNLRLSLIPSHSQIKNPTKISFRDNINNAKKEIKDYGHISKEESEHKNKNEQNIYKKEKIKVLDISSSEYDEDSIKLNYTDRKRNTLLIEKNKEVIEINNNIIGKKYNKKYNKNYNIIKHREKSLKSKEKINLDIDEENILTYNNNQEIKSWHQNLLDKKINTRDCFDLKKNEKDLNDNNK